MNFSEASEYLHSLGNEVETMKLGLENIRTLLDGLGNPQRNYPKVQVAGTNGKGSVCAFLDSICLEAGIRTGRFTSPHLVSIRERIKIEGVDIGESEFARHAAQVRKMAERMVADGRLEMVPTFFEQVTAIALLAFADAEVELAILETGLGGRYDATTAADAEIAAFTRIDIDHQEYLGDTIEKITAEKAAIIREDSRVVIGDQVTEAANVLLDRCRDVGIEPRRVSQSVADRGRNTSGSECAFRVTKAHSLPVVFPPARLGLAGHHQVENAKLAILVAEELNQNFPISEIAIIKGLKNARNPGRLEQIGRILLDGAHNVAGAKALAAYLDEFVDQPITVIFGAVRDKQVAAILEILAERAETFILTRPENTRALDPLEMLKAMPSSFDPKRVFVTQSVEEALNLAHYHSTEGTILVTGSLYLVGEARKLLQEKRKIRNFKFAI